MKAMQFSMSVLATAALAGSASAAHLDGQNVSSDAVTNGLALLATQDTPTQFGNATGGGQDSAGGSELNELYAALNGTTLSLSITGNLESNFNKFWIFLDGVDGGENVLANDNVDGGFNEINSLAGLTFADGATMDHGLRIEIGGGFYGVNAFDLIDNTAASVNSGGGAGALPLSNVAGANGVTFGWDNSNILGVSDVDATGANTATTGWEFEIDLATFFGESPNQVGITAFISNDNGGFLSNQVLPGVNGAGNLADPSDDTLGVVTIAVPEPGSLALLGLGGLLIARRRRA